MSQSILSIGALPGKDVAGGKLHACERFVAAIRLHFIRLCTAPANAAPFRWAEARLPADEQGVRSYLSKSVVLPLPSPPRSEPPETPHAVDRLVDCAASLTDPRLQRLLLRAGEALLDTGPRSAVTRVQ